VGVLGMTHALGHTPRPKVHGIEYIVGEVERI
jgi:hypothetical protein